MTPYEKSLKTIIKNLHTWGIQHLKAGKHE